MDRNQLTDSKLAVGWVNKRIRPVWEIKCLLGHIWKLIHTFKEAKVSHIRRQAKRAPNLLVKTIHRDGVMEVVSISPDPLDLPEGLTNNVNEDHNGKVYVWTE